MLTELVDKTMMRHDSRLHLAAVERWVVGARLLRFRLIALTRGSSFRLMQIYLPIAELSLNVFLLLGLGGAVGFLSGLFGVGGGFLMTPLLIFVGIPPAVAVATEANQIVASSVSGALAHWRRGNVDLKMGMVLLAGGIVGSSLGVWLFSLLRGRVKSTWSFRSPMFSFLALSACSCCSRACAPCDGGDSGRSPPQAASTYMVARLAA